MARALCPGTSYHEQIATVTHLYKLRPNTEQRHAIRTVRNIVKEHRWALVHHIEKSMCPPHGIMGRLCRHVTQPPLRLVGVLINPSPYNKVLQMCRQSVLSRCAPCGRDSRHSS